MLKWMRQTIFKLEERSSKQLQSFNSHICQYPHLFSISCVCAEESRALRRKHMREKAEINTQSCRDTWGRIPHQPLFSFLSCLSISEFLILWSESFSAASQLLHCWDVWLMLQYNLISNIVQKHKNNSSCQNSNSRQSHKSLAGRYRTSRNIQKQSHLGVNNTANGSQRRKHHVFFIVSF